MMALSSTDEVRASLEDSMTENSENTEFLPQQDLLDNLAKENIEIVLRECGVKAHLIVDTVEQVLRGARKTLAILILGRCAARILDFIERAHPHGFPVDGKLPYEREESLKRFGLSQKERAGFFKNQWKIAAPIFDFDSVLPLILNDKTHLPFQRIDRQHTLLGWGGFGEVHRLVIHPRHQIVQIEVSRQSVELLG